MARKNFGFLSTRFAGTDGVSLESAKWARVLEHDDHACFWYAGKLDRPPHVSLCIPEAHFAHPANEWIDDRIWGVRRRDRLVTDQVASLARYLKETLYDFVQHFDIDLLVAENLLTIPMHVPLGIALTEFLAETRMPAIIHHHDFYWERTRYLVNAASDYLDMAFPPRGPNLAHAVINQSAQEQLSHRKGVSSSLIPNVFDFDTPPPGIDDYSRDLRAELGLAPADLLILQPTRVVPRKGIEHAIKLVSLLKDLPCKLVISHDAGDEGLEYREMLRRLALDEGVDLLFASDRVGEIRQIDHRGKKIFTLWDLYAHADLVTYPSIYEGFGNAFLEAIYFRVPIVVNRYSIFANDIEPKGFHLPVMDGFVDSDLVAHVRRCLSDPDHRAEMVEHNYEVARRSYSYAVLRRGLRAIVTTLTG